MRKPVFRVLYQARLKPVFSATETSWSLERSAVESIDIPLSRQRTTKEDADQTVRMCRLICAFVVRENRFSHDVAQIIKE